MWQENFIQKLIFGRYLGLVLENWIKNLKGPKSTFDNAINTSGEILKEFLIFQILWIKQIMLLQLIAEGKLNLVNTST